MPGKKRRRGPGGGSIRLTEAWFLYFGRTLGMQREEVLYTPLGEMRDLVNCQSVVSGNYTQIEYGEVDDLARIR